MGAVVGVGSGDEFERRADYEWGTLSERDADPDPLVMLRRWMDEADEAGEPEPNAMVVATVDAENRPHARNVLLRGIGSDRTLWFFTNRNSAKGVDLAANHAVGLLFSWLAQHRQIRVDGTAEPLTDEESDRYWSGRPRDSQISAWASAQSSVIAGRDVLEAKVAEGVERFGDAEVPRPPEWGGYGVSAVSFEFWQGRRSRLHDRLRYRRPSIGESANDVGWVIERLAP